MLSVARKHMCPYLISEKLAHGLPRLSATGDLAQALAHAAHWWRPNNAPHAHKPRPAGPSHEPLRAPLPTGLAGGPPDSTMGDTLSRKSTSQRPPLTPSERREVWKARLAAQENAQQVLAAKEAAWKTEVAS